MMRFCHDCVSLVEPNGSACPGCGHALDAHAAGYFISGFSAQQAPAVGLQPGRVLLKRYKIRKELGRGATACVYLVFDPLRESEVAIKAILLGASGSETAARQLRDQVAMYDRIHDFEHFIRVYDVQCEPWGGGGLMLLAMEYADGGTFRDWLIEHLADRAERLSQGLEYFRQACRGVAAMHDVGMPHLDVKPENMLLVRGLLKLSDPWTSQLPQNALSSSAAMRQDVRGNGGTAAYMSPERFWENCSGEVDGRADIYSLGVVLHEILSEDGRLPFRGDGGLLRRSHLRCRPPALPSDTGMAGEVAMRCLSDRPEERFASVEELLNALEGRAAAEDAKTAEQTTLPPELQRIWEQAMSSAAAGKPLEAMTLCQQVMESAPEHAGVRLLLQRMEQNHRAGPPVIRGHRGRHRP